MTRVPISRNKFLEKVLAFSVWRKKKFINEMLDICTVAELDTLINAIPSAKLNQTILTSMVVSNELEVVD